MKLTYETASRLHSALTALENEGKFESEDPKTASRIGIMINRLEPYTKVLSKRRDQLQKGLFGHTGPVKNNDPQIDKLGELNDAIRAFLDTEIEDDVKVLTVKMADLKAKENRIAGKTLANMAVMISDFDSDETASPATNGAPKP